MTAALRFAAREPDLPPASARRYFATGNRVICDIGGGAYLVCSIEGAIGDADFYASELADALNANSHLRG